MEPIERDAIVRRLGDNVVRDDSDRLSKILMSAFPFAHGVPDWSQALRVVRRDPPPERSRGANAGPDSLDSKQYAAQVVEFFSECMAQYGIVDDWVMYVGDNTEAEYRVRRIAVPMLLDEVADIPEHKYIFSHDAKWCFGWSFSDELSFGFRPERRPLSC